MLAITICDIEDTNKDWIVEFSNTLPDICYNIAPNGLLKSGFSITYFSQDDSAQRVAQVVLERLVALKKINGSLAKSTGSWYNFKVLVRSILLKIRNFHRKS